MMDAIHSRYEVQPVTARRHRLLLSLLALLIVSGILIFFLVTRLQGPQVVVVSVTRSDVLQTVVASGRVRMPARIEIGSLILGQVTARGVEAGDRVTAGQILLRLDDREARALLDQAKASVEQARARLRQIAELGSPAAEQALREAQARLTQTERQYRRSQELQRKNLISESKVDEDRVAFEVAQTQLETARLQALSNRNAGTEYALAQTALNQAVAALNVAQTRLDYTLIKAPVAAVVVQRSVEAGDVVQPGRPLITLAGDGDTEIIADVDERNLRLLAADQEAQVAADAFADQRFFARLWFIAPAVDATKGSVEIRLRVPSPPAFLRPDMTVSVEIAVARRAGALVLPYAAVRDAATNAPWVMRVRDGIAQRTAVQLGATGSDTVEVVAGLDLDDTVIPGTDHRIGDGQRVRVARLAER